MPKVKDEDGKVQKFPYTKAGMADAKKAAAKPGAKMEKKANPFAKGGKKK